MTIGIGELSRRTGVTQELIRAWETRFGFPQPQRGPGGRREYSETDVDLVQRVVALRDSGVRLGRAVARVRAEAVTGPRSVYAALRERHPEVGARVLRRDVLVAVSHAIEDEAMSRASRPLVFGAFQREAFFRAAADRWDEIARTASSCVVFADFERTRGGSGAPIEVALPPDSPLLREWTVVVVAPAFSVALTAWELPRQQQVPAERREFESLFTFDPSAVRTAAEVCAALALADGDVPEPELSALSESLAAEATPTHGVDALVLRAFDYLQRG